MKKLVLVGLLAVLATGCASTGDLVDLQNRVSSLEADRTSLALEVANCKTQMGALAEKHEQCAKHCKTLETKLDRVFKKSQLK